VREEIRYTGERTTDELELGFLEEGERTDAITKSVWATASAK
jgi:hypothetical protein